MYFRTCTGQPGLCDRIGQFSAFWLQMDDELSLIYHASTANNACKGGRDYRPSNPISDLLLTKEGERQSPSTKKRFEVKHSATILGAMHGLYVFSPDIND